MTVVHSSVTFVYDDSTKGYAVCSRLLMISIRAGLSAWESRIRSLDVILMTSVSDCDFCLFSFWKTGRISQTNTCANKVVVRRMTQSLIQSLTHSLLSLTSTSEAS